MKTLHINYQVVKFIRRILRKIATHLQLSKNIFPFRVLNKIFLIVETGKRYYWIKRYGSELMDAILRMDPHFLELIQKSMRVIEVQDVNTIEAKLEKLRRDQFSPQKYKSHVRRLLRILNRFINPLIKNGHVNDNHYIFQLLPKRLGKLYKKYVNKLKFPYNILKDIFDETFAPYINASSFDLRQLYQINQQVYQYHNFLIKIGKTPLAEDIDVLFFLFVRTFSLFEVCYVNLAQLLHLIVEKKPLEAHKYPFNPAKNYLRKRDWRFEIYYKNCILPHKKFRNGYVHDSPIIKKNGEFLLQFPKKKTYKKVKLKKALMNLRTNLFYIFDIFYSFQTLY